MPKRGPRDKVVPVARHFSAAFQVMSHAESLGGHRLVLVLSLAGAATFGGTSLAQGLAPGRLQPGSSGNRPPPPVLTGNFVSGPTGVQDLRVEALIAGDLDGNRSLEVAALHGGRLVLFVNPDVGDEYVVVASGVRTLTNVPGENRFLFTTDAGLAAL